MKNEPLKFELNFELDTKTDPKSLAQARKNLQENEVPDILRSVLSNAVRSSRAFVKENGPSWIEYHWPIPIGPFFIDLIWSKWEKFALMERHSHQYEAQPVDDIDSKALKLALDK